MEAIHLKSSNYPESHISIATDWCNPFFLPHNHEGPKGWLRAQRPKASLFGLMQRSDSTTTHLKYHMEFWCHNANLHISILYAHLRSLREKGKLPSHLILQFDNCAKDNKNRWLYAFLAHLIHKKWCLTITLYFLMPGHSHDMVDHECFAPLGKKNFRYLHSCWTFDEFPSFLKGGFRRRTIKPIISGDIVVYDWKTFFKHSLKNFSKHSFPRAFLFRAVPDDEERDQVVLFYKKSVLTPKWRGFQSK